MAYYLVLTPNSTFEFGGDGDAHVFPSYAKLLPSDFDPSTASSSKSSNASKVSGKYNKTLKRLYEKATKANVDEDLTPRLSSHSQKKVCSIMFTQIVEAYRRLGMLNKMTTSTVLNPIWTCFRAGSVMRNVHTLFDYVTNQTVNDQQCAKLISDWSQSDVKGHISGGVPPSFKCIDLPVREKMHEFAANLFKHVLFSNDEATKLPLSVANLLAANLLRFWEDFLLMLESDHFVSMVDGIGVITSTHPFKARVMEAAYQTGLSEAELRSAGVQIKKTIFD